MKILFLDEAGDHDLQNVDDHFPIFVLGGCIMGEKYHSTSFQQVMQTFKKNLFGWEDIVLHYADYMRNKNGFERVKEKSFREKFFFGLNKIIHDSYFTLLSCIIDKRKHNEKYGMLALDPYHFSLQIIVERFIHFLKKTNANGAIIAESRGKQFDNQLELAYLDLKIKGTKYCSPSDITDWIEGFYIRKKKENIAGLQLTDSLVTPVGRKYLKRNNYYLNYDSIKSKFRRHTCGKYQGYGLIILPK